MNLSQRQPSRIRGAIVAAGCGILGATLLAAPAMGQESAEPSPNAKFVPSEVLVRFDDQKTEQVIELPSGVGVREAVRNFRDNEDVASAVPNYIARASFIPKDPGRGGGKGGWQEDQWNFLGGPGGVNAVDAWDILRAADRPGGRRPNGKRGTKVAVVDTGVAYRSKGSKYKRSPDLPADAFTRGKDFVDDDRLPLDENGHGTHIASTIVERTHNGKAVTGLAYGVRVMPVRVLDAGGSGSAKDVARGIRYAANKGAKVINLSLEFGLGAVESCSDIPGVCRAIRKAIKKGALVVAAAGNQGRDQVAYPAFADNPDDKKGVSAKGPVLAVGAGSVRGCLSDFSNYGPGLDLVAPGGGDDRGAAGAHCDPFGPAPGIVQMTLKSAPALNGDFKQFGFPRYDGTSMAAAHVSAAAALVLSSKVLRKSLKRKPKPADIEKWMEARTRTGVDGVQLEEKFYGAGLLDAAAALAK
ncbi:MAG: S8 family serine peptidase [Solirubrobacterales bacterium]